MKSARSCVSLFNHYEARDNAGAQEKRIHTLLDQHQIHQINVKEYVESLQRHESPNVKKLMMT